MNIGDKVRFKVRWYSSDHKVIEDTNEVLEGEVMGHRWDDSWYVRVEGSDKPYYVERADIVEEVIGRMMRFEKIKASELQSVVDLLVTGFDAVRTVLEDTMKKILDSSETWGHIYGLWEGDLLVGTISYGSCFAPPLWNGEGVISHLVVREGYRRRGLARKMIDKALSDMKAQYLPCVAITVAVGNDVALGIWKSYGFELYCPACEVVGHADKYEGYVKWFWGGK